MKREHYASSEMLPGVGVRLFISRLLLKKLSRANGRHRVRSPQLQRWINGGRYDKVRKIGIETVQREACCRDRHASVTAVGRWLFRIRAGRAFIAARRSQARKSLFATIPNCRLST